MTPARYITPGEILLDKYRVDHVLGSGGMGMVLAATHLHLQERVAMKFLLPAIATDEKIVQRFVREAQAAARLRGEHAARVIDVGLQPDGVPYMIMEYLEGEDLGRRLKRGPLPVGVLIDHVLQACEALAEAHALGIVHRDLKPSNLFLTWRPDGSPQLKLLDFGISKMPNKMSRGLTSTHTVLGTPAYMSPEQMRDARDVDARADVWALGVILYEALCGRRPFEDKRFAMLCLKVATEPAPPMGDVPRGLEQIVRRCLEKSPAARFETVAELAIALAPHAANQAAATLVVQRTRAMLGTAAATVAAGLASTMRASSSPSQTEEPHTTFSACAGEPSAKAQGSRLGFVVGGALAGLIALATSLVLTLVG